MKIVVVVGVEEIDSLDGGCRGRPCFLVGAVIQVKVKRKIEGSPMKMRDPWMALK